MATIDEALRLLRDHSGEAIGEGEPAESIAKAEAALGINFPSSYRRFLQDLGYAEVFGEEIYSIYEEPIDSVCLGIVQQNAGTPLLRQGYLAFLSTDVDGTFLMKLANGSAYLNDIRTTSPAETVCIRPGSLSIGAPVSSTGANLRRHQN